MQSVGYTRNYFFGQDNYYTKDIEKLDEAVDRSIWGGKGAETLGLTGRVDPVEFGRLLAGELPAQSGMGEHARVGVERNGIWQHRPGFDLTFSAPKSFSMLMLMTDDPKLKAAMQHMLVESVKATMDDIEKDGACARKTENGQTVYEKTGNLVYAMHLHDISREGDPQSHVHTVVMNMSERTDGNWRALGSSAKRYGQHVGQVEGFLEHVRSNKKYYGMRMRAELAYRLKTAGIDIVAKPHGQFEIAGISQASIKHYSQRSTQIEAYLKQNHLKDTAVNRAHAALNTRQQKTPIPRSELAQNWAERNVEAQGVPFKEVRQVTKTWQQHERGETVTPVPSSAQKTSPNLVQHLQKTLKTLSAQQISFTPSMLINRVMADTIGERFNTDEILNAVKTLEASGELVILEAGHAGQSERYVTCEQLDTVEDRVPRL